MRRNILLGASALIAVGLTGASLADEFAGEKPAAQTADRLEWAWDGGDRIGIALPATVHYQAGGNPRVVVRGPADLLARVRYDHGDLGLERSLFDWSSDGEKLDVTLTGMTLHKVGLAGRVDMTMGEIHQDRLDISIAGRGTVEASGGADELSLKIAGSGDYQLGKLAAKSLEVRIAGSGQVAAASADRARVSITGSGDVHFASAMPKDISTDITGSGSVSDANGQVIGRNEARLHRDDGTR
jgi:hypothetical protein